MNSADKIARAVIADYEKMAGPILADQKKWERLIAPHVAAINHAARQMEKQQREFQKSIKALMPDFSEMIAAMEEEQRRFPDQVRLMAKHGWYMPPELTPRMVAELTNALADNRAPEVEAAMIDYYSGQLDKIESSLCKQAPTRERHLRSAFAAHRRGDYIASIVLMLAQADGLCRDFTGNHLFSGRDKLTAQFKSARPYVLSLLIAIRETMPLSENEQQRAGKVGLFNRHAIMHGESLDYDSAANSCRAISLLVYVAWALGEVHRATPKDARPASGQHPGRVRGKAASPAKPSPPIQSTPPTAKDRKPSS